MVPAWILCRLCSSFCSILGAFSHQPPVLPWCWWRMPLPGLWKGSGASSPCLHSLAMADNTAVSLGSGLAKPSGSDAFDGGMASLAALYRERRVLEGNFPAQHGAGAASLVAPAQCDADLFASSSVTSVPPASLSYLHSVAPFSLLKLPGKVVARTGASLLDRVLTVSSGPRPMSTGTGCVPRNCRCPQGPALPPVLKCLVL